MRTIDWDWAAQLKACEIRIAELEAKIALQRQKVQHRLEWKMSAISAQHMLTIWKQSLDRVQSYKHLIETRIAERRRSTAPCPDPAA